MKKIFITFVALLFVQVTIFAQTPVVSPADTPAQNPKTEKNEKNQKGRNQRERQPKMTAAERAVQYSMQLKTGLSLSDAQYQQVLAINTECVTRKDALRGNQDRSAMKTGKEEIKAYRLAEFQKVFLADQMSAYQNMNDDNDGKEGKDQRDENRGKDRRGKGKGRDKKDKESDDDNEKKND
jgi:hypothetical protein